MVIDVWEDEGLVRDGEGGQAIWFSSDRSLSLRVHFGCYVYSRLGGLLAWAIHDEERGTRSMVEAYPASVFEEESFGFLGG